MSSLYGSQAAGRYNPWRVRLYPIAIVPPFILPASGMGVPLPWAGAVFDTVGAWTPGFPDRLTMPAGFVAARFWAHVEFPLDATAGSCRVLPFWNGIGEQMLGEEFPASQSLSVMSDHIQIASGDYFQLYMAQYSGVDVQVVNQDAFRLEMEFFKQ